MKKIPVILLKFEVNIILSAGYMPAKQNIIYDNVGLMPVSSQISINHA